MACATLKRPIEFDPLHSPNPTKRPRCMPMCISPSNSPPRNLSSPPRPSTSSSGCGGGGGNILLNNAYSPFVSRMAKLTPEAIASGIFEEMRRLHRRKELHIPSSSIHHHAAAMSSSNASGVVVSLLSQESSHHAHLHHHHHHHQVHPSLVSTTSSHLHNTSNNSNTSASGSTTCGGGVTSPSTAATGVSTAATGLAGGAIAPGGVSGSSTDDRDKPIFTFRQVEYICSKMLTEQEDKMRAEYDEILNAKLKEQFDIFNRFSVDQIDRLAKHNNQSALSYLS